MGLQSFDSGFAPTKMLGGSLVENVQISAATAYNTIRVTGVYKGNASTSYDIPACFCKCPVTNCCPTEKWQGGGKGVEENDWQLTCDQNWNSYSPLRAGCF